MEALLSMNVLPTAATLQLALRGSVLFATIDRPQARNALSLAVREDLARVVDWLRRCEDVRALVLRGSGGNFCGGGDLNDFKRNFELPPPGAGERDAVAVDNRRFGDLLLALRSLPQAVISLVEGDAFGGAVGLICASDIAIGIEATRFAISETSLGVVPAQIAPFVVQRIGVSHALRLALSGLRFDGREALRIGLLHHCVDSSVDAELQLEKILAGIGRCGPQANATTKRLLLRAAADGGGELPALLDWAAERFAERLRSFEGREGVSAFLEKRRAEWAAVDVAAINASALK